MKECKLAILKNVEIKNKKTGSITYGDIEYYANTRTGKMMFSGRSYGSLKPVYWLAKNCQVKQLNGFMFDLRIA